MFSWNWKKLCVELVNLDISEPAQSEKEKSPFILMDIKAEIVQNKNFKYQQSVICAHTFSLNLKALAC